MKRIIVGMTGATGAPLEFLHDLDVEVHLIVSQWARATLLQECGINAKDLKLYASVVHDARDQGASSSSGSFHTDGMIVVPCSMKTLAAIRCGHADNLIARAADVTIKERRRLIFVARETPLSPIHLESLLELSRIGATSFPPTAAFCNQPASVDAVLDHLAVRILNQFGLEHPAARSPVEGVWEVYHCEDCFFAWRSTEPGFITDPTKYDAEFKLNRAELDQADIMPNVPPLRARS